jgi:hypothetical protein
VVLYGIGAFGVAISPLTDGTGVDGESSDVADWVQVASSGATALLIGIGLVVRRRSRVSAYRWFKAGIMVSLLITQVFVFYHDQFSALIGVVLSLVLYAALTYMIHQEEARELEAPSTTPSSAPLAHGAP